MKPRCARSSMGSLFVWALCFAGIIGSSQAASVSFRWIQNTETNLAGYKLYYGPSSRNYTNHVLLGKVGNYTMNGLVNGATYYFALTAINSTNAESDFSAELRFPNAPVVGAISNATVAEDAVATVPVHVSDVDSPIANVTLSATSSDQLLVPNNNMSFSGTGTNRSLRITPGANRTGSVNITVTANDGTLTSAARTFTLTVSGNADPPSFVGITNVTTDEDLDTPLIQFTLVDPETPSPNFAIRATSSNPTLIPTNRIILNGTNSNRTLRLRPMTNQFGSATITLTTSDGALSASTNFNFIVRSVNDLPTITQITNRTYLEDQKRTITFNVADVETSSTNLQLTATSSDSAIVPQADLQLAVTPTNRTITVCPATNAVGSATVTITVNDGQNSVSEPFTVTYTAVNDVPVVSAMPNLTINKFDSVAPIPFTAWDVETPVNSLTFTVSSTNLNLVHTNNTSVSGSGTNRILTVTPTAGQTGMTRIAVRAYDGTTNTVSFFYLTVTGSNSPPVLTVPGTVSGDPGTPIAIRGIRVADPDVGTNNLSFTLSAPNGTLLVLTSVTAGVRANHVTGNNSGSVTVIAPLTALNTTLADPNGLVYTSRPGFPGPESLVVMVSDRGFTGPGGVKTDTETITISLAPPNSLELWRTANFSATDLQDASKEATVWGDLADPDSDGRNNLMEFALGLNPLGSEPQDDAFVSQTVNSGGNQYLTLTFNSRINEPLLQYIVEVSGDNVTWSATNQRIATVPVNAQFERVTYQDPVPITPANARFIRLRVVKNGP